MYLKSLEIQGFKSFPEKTRLTFEKSITGIVGPNGSGKSNISDAILWVMGEQSTRTLRGGRMEDVIFGGTQRRVQVGFAEVSLILDNSDRALDLDNSEVMITRRYYRSGESEYYINRKQVRLRDINELLMDTGLGREGYSIIGQGKIDEILSVKSRDRRELFEEAAGISRYRHRKEESERKLAQTDENLVRINDKISELELQLEPLRTQAETAKKYLLLRDELRSLEITAWMRDLEKLHGQIKKLEQSGKTAKDELTTATTSLERTLTQADSHSELMRQCDIDVESIRAQISLEETRCADENSEIAVLKSQLEGNIARISGIEQELASQDGHSDGISAQIVDRKSRISEITSKRVELVNAAARLQANLHEIIERTGKSSKQTGELLRRESNAVNMLSDFKAKVSALASLTQELYDREATLITGISSLSETLVTLKSEFELCQAEYEQTLAERTSQNNVINGFKIRLSSKSRKLTAVQERYDGLLLERKTLESRLNLLQEMEKEYLGFSKAVKLVIQESERGFLENIHGTVAGLIRTDEKYTIAIETALGGAMQNIIVGGENDGKAAITLLKHKDAGRATFLPLSTVRGSVLDDKALVREDGFVGIALNLVSFKHEYRNIYANLLGRCVIASDLNAAIRISRKFGNRFKIVTLDGQVINAGGSMTGGSVVKSAGILSRANEIKSLTRSIDEIRATVSSCEREVTESRREVSAAEYELETATAEMRAIEDKLLKLDSQRLHFESRLIDSETALNSQNREKSVIAERIKKTTDETSQIRQATGKLEAELREYRRKIDDATQGQSELQNTRERVTSELSELRSQIASLDVEHDVLTKAIAELTGLHEEIRSGRIRQAELKDDLNKKNIEIREEIYAKERKKEKMYGIIGEYKGKMSELGSRKLELEAMRVTLSKKTQDLNNLILELERECSRLEQQYITTQMEEKQIIDKLWDTYELTRTTARAIALPADDPAESARNIARLKREIAALGNPNIGAIEEFERINTRYVYLTTQRDDVTNAKNELATIVSDITEQMRGIFTRGFKAINKSFKETFVELFGGGYASLELEDTGDVLECGIEINVQPPGKSLKTLSLLSGGEKAFVAIALYFAILKVRPTPFVVMDEIEAALDDANVLRFAERLRIMSKNTQMIVISHRRGTMEEADVLYGVTMHELGVSRILKIDLDEADHRLMA